MTDNLSFTAKITYIPYFDEKSSWGVLDVVTDQNLPHSRKTFDFDLDTNQTIEKYSTRLVGKLPTPHIGQEISVLAYHEYNTKFKRDQYTIVQLTSKQPKTQAENIAYLKSLVTDNQAESLLKSYPNIVQEIIDGVDNVDLNLLPGIGKITYDKIKDKVIENFAISDILGLLVPLGVSFSKIQKLMDGERNPQILKEKIIKNPYKLTEIRGINFLTADKIAISLNKDLKESEDRLVAFIKYDLEKIGDSDGDCWIEIDQLRSDVLDVVPGCEKFFVDFINKEKINSTILHIDSKHVGLKYYYDTEKYIYDFLLKVHKSVPLTITQENIEFGILESEEQQGFKYSEEQKQILYEMTKNNLAFLSGAAGSGKTSLSRGILNIYDNAGYSLAVCALSSKAAKRSTEVTGYPASTVHRLLESDSTRFVRNENNKLKESTILIDEASMLNSWLLMSLFKAIDPEKTKIVLVGDHAQLAPIQFGQPFTDLLGTTNQFKKTLLTEVYRQAKNSSIFIDAMMVRNKETPVPSKERMVKHGDITYIFSDDKEYLHSVALSSYVKAVNEDGVENVVLLSPRKKEVLNSTHQFNIEIQKLINFENLENKFEYGKKKFLLNDRVIQIVNDRERNVYNGFVGKITQIKKDGFIALFDDNLFVEYNKDNINDIELASSISSHRSQGSQYLSVIVVLDMSSFMLLSNQMLYTSMSRGQKRVLICAQPKAFDMCMDKFENERNTYLKGFLENEQ